MSSYLVQLAPQLILAGGGLLVWGVGACRPRQRNGWLFAITLITALLAAYVSLGCTGEAQTVAGSLDVSGFAKYFTFLFSALTALVALYLFQYARRRKFESDEMYGLLLFAALGMSITAGAVNWPTLFLGLETFSICLYVLIAIHRDEAHSNEAGLKYFITGAVASSFLVFGLALLYAATGRLDLAGSLSNIPAGQVPYVLAALALVMVGLGFKLSIVPFHLWTPDVYQGRAGASGRLSVHRFQSGPGRRSDPHLLPDGRYGLGSRPARYLGPVPGHHGNRQYHGSEKNQPETAAGLFIHGPHGIRAHGRPGRQRCGAGSHHVLPGGLHGHGRRCFRPPGLLFRR